MTYRTGISKIMLVKNGHGFSNNYRSICVNNFLNVKLGIFKNCVCVFRETGSATHKKGAGRSIVRTEQVVNDVQRMEQDPTKHTK
jgi:uncharacterized protein YvpB